MKLIAGLFIAATLLSCDRNAAESKNDENFSSGVPKITDPDIQSEVDKRILSDYLDSKISAIERDLKADPKNEGLKIRHSLLIEKQKELREKYKDTLQR